MVLVRRVGAVVLALAALIVCFAMAPSSEDFQSQVSAVMADDDLNQRRAEGAPQQAVVNGWVARDLLQIIARQLDSPHDHRPAALLTIAVLGLALYIFTTGGPLFPQVSTDSQTRPAGLPAQPFTTPPGGFAGSPTGGAAPPHAPAKSVDPPPAGPRPIRE